MAENTGKTTGAAEHKPNHQLELKKEEALMFFLDKTREFMKVDGEINESLKQLLGAIVKHAEKDPRVLFSGSDNIDALLAALKTKTNPEGRGDAGVSGHDIVGGSLLDDIGNFIKELGDLIAAEKKFFLAILLLIFCDNACDCICSFINKG